MSARAFIVDVDALAGIAALAFAIAGFYVPAAESIVPPETAGCFALVALGRAYRRHREP